MATNNVPQIYTWVIQDVAEKMGRKFAELGLDENILTDLKQLWEDKIRKMNVAQFGPAQPSQGSYIQYQQQNPNAGDMPNFNFQPDMSFSGMQGYFPQVPQNDGANDDELKQKKEITSQVSIASRETERKKVCFC
jgi:hypothetical protein